MASLVPIICSWRHALGTGLITVRAVFSLEGCGDGTDVHRDLSGAIFYSRLHVLKDGEEIGDIDKFLKIIKHLEHVPECRRPHGKSKAWKRTSNRFRQSSAAADVELLQHLPSCSCMKVATVTVRGLA